MKSGRYCIVLYLHLLMIFSDIFINTFADILNVENVIELVLYVLQDTFILLDIIIVFLMFFGTFAFQAGLIWVLISKFRCFICTSSIYLGLSIACHTWKLNLNWTNRNFVWPTGYHLIFILQRTVAALFYHFYSQTVTHLSNPKYYRRSKWFNLKLLG